MDHIELDDHFYRPEILPRKNIEIDAKYLHYHNGFRHGIFTGAGIMVVAFAIFLLLH